MTIQISDMIPGALNCMRNIGSIKPGEDILILCDTTNDQDLVETYRIAALSVGCKATVLSLQSSTAGANPEEIVKKGLTGPWPKVAYHAMKGADIVINLTNYGDMHSIYGTSHSQYKIGKLDFFEKYNTRMISVAISNKEALASDWASYPQSLLKYLAFKSQQCLDEAIGDDPDNAILKVTDPTGTDLTVKGFRVCTSHLMGDRSEDEEKLKPFYTFGTEVIGVLPHYPEPNAEGIIVSTSTHGGYIPEVRATIKGGRVVNLEGMSDVVKVWTTDWEKGKDVIAKDRQTIFGGHEKPGINWVEEIMYGIHPRAFRLGYKYRYEGSDAFHAWVGGTRRSGTIHFGIGGGIDEWYRHRDLELFHSTVSVNGHELITEGRLLILDDPEVRKEAVKYGDPDDLLTEKWIPEIPGRD